MPRAFVSMVGFRADMQTLQAMGKQMVAGVLPVVRAIKIDAA
jgi:hypothetical protein